MKDSSARPPGVGFWIGQLVVWALIVIALVAGNTIGTMASFICVPLSIVLLAWVIRNWLRYRKEQRS